MTSPPTVRSRVDTVEGRVEVEDVVGALVGEVEGHKMREKIEGEGLEETVRMRRR